MKETWASIKAERKSAVNRQKSIRLVADLRDGHAPGLTLLNTGVVDTTVVEMSFGTLLNVSDAEFVCLTTLFEQNLQRLASAPDSIKAKKKFPFYVSISTASVDTTINLANKYLTTMLLRGLDHDVVRENTFLTTTTKEHLHKAIIYNVSWIGEN